MDRNETTLMDAIEQEYLPHIVRNYAAWTTNTSEDSQAEIDRRVNDFDLRLTFRCGRNYIKIITGTPGGQQSVHSFIVIKPTKGYEIGDVLKAASWNAPATNFKRGNVFEAPFKRVTWTGAG